jgi:hypothetical protein
LPMVSALIPVLSDRKKTGTAGLSDAEVSVSTTAMVNYAR